jgi:hypothetical protein
LACSFPRFTGVLLQFARRPVRVCRGRRLAAAPSIAVALAIARPPGNFLHRGHRLPARGLVRGLVTSGGACTFPASAVARPRALPSSCLGAVPATPATDTCSDGRGQVCTDNPNFAEGARYELRLTGVRRRRVGSDDGSVGAPLGARVKSFLGAFRRFLTANRRA